MTTGAPGPSGRPIVFPNRGEASKWLRTAANGGQKEAFWLIYYGRLSSEGVDGYNEWVARWKDDLAGAFAFDGKQNTRQKLHAKGAFDSIHHCSFHINTLTEEIVGDSKATSLGSKARSRVCVVCGATEAGVAFVRLQA